MNLNDLFPVQAELDSHIIEEHNLQGQDLLEMKVNALNCELWECMNESKVFKFWSYKKPNRDKLLEEYVDCIHFALSIGNDLGYTEHQYEETETIDLNRLANGISNLITLTSEARYQRHISTLLNLLIKLGYQLGFDEETVKQAYFEKNKINFERQLNNY